METKEITIIDRVASLETASGLALEFKVQELNKLAERAKAIESAEDPLLKEVKKEMVAKRNYIKTYCLDARREVKKVAEGISEVEGMLLDIFVGEEKRLDEMTEVARKAKEREERIALLPQRIARLVAIWGEGNVVGVNQEELLEMDGATFEGLVNRMTNEKLEADRAEIARQQAEIDRQRDEQAKEALRLENEKKALETAELARKEERERIEREQNEKEERERAEKLSNRKKKLLMLGLMPNSDTQCYEIEGYKVSHEEVNQLEDGAWALLIEKIETEIKQQADAKIEAERVAKLEADQRYQAWLTEIGYVEGEFILNESTSGHIVAYKLVATFKK